MPIAADGGASFYNDEIIKAGVVATAFWGLVGFVAGLVIALQLAYPALNFDVAWFSFGRLRPVHTSAVIFAFGGNALLVTSFYVVQRTCRARPCRRCCALVRFLGVSAFHRFGGQRLCPGRYPIERICGTRMVYRLVADDCLGRLSACLFGDALAPARTAYLCRELVLSCLHRDDCTFAYREQSFGSRVADEFEKLYAFLRCAGCLDPMVVWP